MREIKFRVIYNGKIIGYERIGKDGWEWMCPDLNPDGKERWCPGLILRGDVIRDQFTGLTDKNGKKIYEGDVLCWPNYEGTKNETRWVMQWDNYRAAWTDYSPKEEAQITGTIHD